MLTTAILDLNNGSTSLRKLGAFTHTTTNVAVASAVAAVLFKKNVLAATALSATASAAAASEAPLSNTLFYIHPVMLIAGVTLCAVSSARSQAVVWYPLLCLGLAMFLGGFWSSQELNWGGWWNWDVLEMGSLLVWLAAAAGAHAGQTTAPRSAARCAVATLGAAFYVLNKTGVGVSIHSFVTSEVLRTNHLAIGLTALVAQSAPGGLAPVACAGACLAYSGATDLRALKLLCILAVFGLRANKSRAWQRLAHLSALAAAAAGVVFNYSNTLLSAHVNPQNNVFGISAPRRVILRSGDHLFAHLSGWRAKPHNSWGASLGACGRRSPTGVTRWAAYPK